ncbi:MAG: HAD family phosphatase [Candidatus Margulisiibacteriota bacterium]
MKKLKNKFSAILFDMDGVIVDSMPYHYIAWYEALLPYGIRATVFDAYIREGEKWQKTLKELFAREGLKFSARIGKNIFNERSKIFKKYFRRHIFFGVEGFLSCIKARGYLLALVSGTPEKEINKILPKNIRDKFNVIVAGDHLKVGKPHPAPYLKASRALKVIPKKCAVVENAPNGIASAKAAGMFCFAVTTSLPKEYLKSADIIVDKLEEITGYIDSACGIKG